VGHFSSICLSVCLSVCAKTEHRLSEIDVTCYDSVLWWTREVMRFWRHLTFTLTFIAKANARMQGLWPCSTQLNFVCFVRVQMHCYALVVWTTVTDRVLNRISFGWSHCWLVTHIVICCEYYMTKPCVPFFSI